MLTRSQVYEDYQITDFRITTPGKFGGELAFAPYFYEQTLEGFADEELTAPGGLTTFIILISSEDRQVWPELGVQAFAIAIEDDEQGFVHCTQLSRGKLARVMLEYSLEEDAEEDEYNA